MCAAYQTSWKVQADKKEKYAFVQSMWMKPSIKMERIWSMKASNKLVKKEEKLDYSDAAYIYSKDQKIMKHV